MTGLRGYGVGRNRGVTGVTADQKKSPPGVTEGGWAFKNGIFDR
jgi:hypothetical protein